MRIFQKQAIQKSPVHKIYFPASGEGYLYKIKTMKHEQKVDNVTRVGVRLSDDAMKQCNKTWLTWSNMYGVKW